MFLNKKFIIALLLALASMAHADGCFDNTLYSIGGEMSILNRTAYSSANTNDLNNFKASNSDSELVIRKNKLGFSGFVQARFNQWVGIEAGYGIILKVTGTAQGGNSAYNKISIPYLDLIGFMSVAERVDLIGEVGVAYMKSDANVSNVVFYDLNSLNSPKVGFRAGAGAMFLITGNWATRIILRYIEGNKAFLKSDTQLALGIQYTF
jgi:opacity protein-like surface antigen